MPYKHPEDERERGARRRAKVQRWKTEDPARYEAHLVVQRAASRKSYRNRNKEKLAENLRQWRAANPEAYEAQKVRNREKTKRSRLKRVSTPEGRALENAKHREYMAQPHAKEQRRNYVFKKTYGISSEDYDRILVAQNHVCAICKQGADGKKKAHVDHDHTSNEVRGVLCNLCNVGLGIYEKHQRPAGLRFTPYEEYLNNPPARSAKL